MLGKTLNLTRYAFDPTSALWAGVEAQSFSRLPVPISPCKKTVRAGWCHPQNPLLVPSLVACKREPWWHLGLRIDTWAAPGAPLRAALDLRKRQWMGEMGCDKVPKAVVEELRELTYSELARPTTQHVEVAWNLSHGLLLLGSTTSAVQTAFENKARYR